MNLPVNIEAALVPLFELLPLEKAMPDLVVKRHASERAMELVAALVASPEFSQMPTTCSGLWLYVDDLARSHALSQGINSRTGSAWHAIMHRREGDFGNCHYWFRSAGAHPAFETVKGYDSHNFVHAVEAASGANTPELVDLQRQEWCALFSWCAENEKSHTE